jgi:DNA replication protein DnaC
MTNPDRLPQALAKLRRIVDEKANQPAQEPENAAPQGYCERHRLAFERVELGDGIVSGCYRCEAAERAKQDRLSRSGLRERFVQATLDAHWIERPEDDRAVKAARELLAAGDEWAPLLLVGTKGTGKTHLLSALVWHTIVDRRRDAIYTTAHDLIIAVRNTWRPEAEEGESALIERLTSVALLVVDDLGVSFNSEGEQVHLFDIFDRRWSNNLPIAVASNLDPGALRVAVGDRVYDRLRDNATMITFTGQSRRGPKAGAR